MLRKVSVVLFAAMLAAGCRDDDQRTDSADPAAAMQLRANWSPEAVAHLDAGNEAIRADSFDVARIHFLAVTVAEPEIAAGWFGLYLAEQGLGDGEAAGAALERARELAVGANLIHPNEGGGS